LGRFYSRERRHFAFPFERNARRREPFGVIAVVRVSYRSVEAPADEGPDVRLAARLARGDLAALGEAYDAFHEHVRRFARRLIRDDAAAEDLVQETFVALPSAARRYRGDAPLRSFVVGVAANHARHHTRSVARRAAALSEVAREADPPPSGPEARASRHELAAALRDALEELPIDQRIAIVLCEVEERTAGEVAKMVGAPEATVRTRVFHGKKKLREALTKRGLV
jgi:RNA polymerase sigma-70 factor, ECF subfamily